MTLGEYLEFKERLLEEGYEDEIAWAENIKPCEDSDLFAREAMWIILNSGMKNQVARAIEGRIYAAWGKGQRTSSAFGHKGKVRAIDSIFREKERLLQEYGAAQTVEDKIAYLTTLPYIGKITAWHLAKNLGLDCCKPDRHLVRIAKKHGTTPAELCQSLSQASGDRIATVDQVLWRAANLGFI